jgi:AcrR family transcriptional regulator
MEHSREKKMRVAEIAEACGVTTQAVYYWVRNDQHLTWHRSSDGCPYALKDEVMEFAKGYIGRGRRRESVAN